MATVAFASTVKNNLAQLVKVAVDEEPIYLGPVTARGPNLTRTFYERIVHHRDWVPTTIESDNVLQLSNEQARSYLRTLASLEVEPELEHLSRREDDDALWALYCEVAVNRDEYKQDAQKRIRSINAFQTNFATAHIEFEVLFEIENLNVVVDPPPFLIPFQMGERQATAVVVITTLTPDDRREWRLPELNEPPGDEDPTTTPFGETVAKVTLEAGTTNLAVKRAGSACDRALNLLRVGILANRVLWTDYQLRQHRTSRHRVRTRLAKTRGSGWRLDNPVHYDFAADDQKEVARLMSRLTDLRSSFVSPKLVGAFLRAYDWVGTSATRQDPDDKVTDLCTALECVLTSKDDRMKGEAIVLRALMLGQVPPDPLTGIRVDRLYDLYEKRSAVVHGVERGISTERDYQELRRWTMAVLEQVLSMILDNRETIKRSIHLIAALKTREQLAVAVTYLESWPSENKSVRPVLELARSLINPDPSPGCGTEGDARK